MIYVLLLCMCCLEWKPELSNAPALWHKYRVESKKESFIMIPRESRSRRFTRRAIKVKLNIVWDFRNLAKIPDAFYRRHFPIANLKLATPLHTTLLLLHFFSDYVNHTRLPPHVYSIFYTRIYSYWNIKVETLPEIYLQNTVLILIVSLLYEKILFIY